jgi:hypothetical protein
VEHCGLRAVIVPLAFEQKVFDFCRNYSGPTVHNSLRRIASFVTVNQYRDAVLQWEKSVFEDL